MLKKGFAGESFNDIAEYLIGAGRPEYSLEGLMLKLKLQYFGYLM